MPEVTTAAFADDTALMATGKDPDMSTTKVQQATNKFIKWAKRWKIKLNELKSTTRLCLVNSRMFLSEGKLVIGD